MSPRRKTSPAIPSLPSWVSALAAAFLAFFGTWSALRVTVDSLQDDVSSLKSLVQTVAVLDAQVRAHTIEMSTLRGTQEDTRVMQSKILERVSALEAKSRR